MANGDIEVTSTAKSTTAVGTTNNVASSVVGAGTLAAGVSTLAGLSFSSSTKLPLVNALHKYASSTYVFTLAALDTKSLNAPDMTYIKGGKLPIVLKTGGSNPENRVKTKFGKFDFYIDELTIDSTYGFMQGTGNTNATGISMTVSEPLSMGMFPISLNQAAYDAGYTDFRSCIFLLKIEFKGQDTNGVMSSIPNTTKYIPLNFRDLQMSVSEGGSIYKCEAIPAADIPMLSSNCTVTTDITITGSSVVEILQTGPNSLQAVLNRRLQEVAKNSKAVIADEILIVFPGESKDLTASKPGESELESKAKAIEPVVKQADDAAIFKELNVKRSTINKTLIQSSINEIGAADLGYSQARQSKTAAVDVAKAYDAATGFLTHNSAYKNPKICDYVFQQNSTILNAINQVILTSEYAVQALKTQDNNGMRKWWRIETAIYHVDSKENFPSTGKKPQIIVYKVLPYQVHASDMPIPGVESSTFKKLINQCVKIYNYIYTGKNSDILKFNLDFDNRFVTAITNDEFRNSGSLATSTQDGVAGVKRAAVDPTQPDTKPKNYSRGYNPIVGRNSIGSSQDWRGGGGEETSAHRAARVFHDAITFGQDLQRIEMDIVGDPYWLTGNGLGNYSSPSIPEKINLSQDGSVNYQNGEVDMAINFRTPIDINSATGMYNMAVAGSAQFSGLYRVQKVIHRFRDGNFTQTIKANRRQISPTDTGDVSFDVKDTSPVILAGDNPAGTSGFGEANATA